ncbi:nitroreductase family deazaflavin-dependent oxidoreductase [Mycolicibacterium farcinogenes]|uniref:nitroreductase family deazaflavin-dependent oxidoreductase n=1 Tax=Mycolicibacterium farcinogenes TaxID=1802 RepID=UPI001C8E9345|nr:nitroreductase family deazaflavin-dependent oxidoreductase [Mycolicibacterium farcinogenes]QZH58318.1 nitroreductase family deazaflavin-dependent oxidoreductase [Mycolicibacterium farcinogenes]
MSETDYTAPDLALVGADHIDAYQKSGGKLGYLWNGVPTLLLTVTGRRSGVPRTSALIFGRDGDNYLVVASMGGAPMHPQWYRNIVANPEAQIQVRDKRFDVMARTASADEKPRLWQILTELWPNYDVYQSRTDRDIPVVILEPR